MVISADWVAGLGIGASTVSVPSGEREEETRAGSTPGGSVYFRVKHREMKPCSSCLSSCLPGGGKGGQKVRNGPLLRQAHIQTCPTHLVAWTQGRPKLAKGFGGPPNCPGPSEASG